MVLFLLLLAASRPPVETHYEIDLAQSAARTLLVTVETECATADCDFQMPVWNATYQVRDFAQHVTHLEAARPNGEPLRHRLLAPSRWRVEAAAGERVRLRYHYLADNPGPFGCSASSRHVFLNFAQALAYPVDRLREPMTVRFRNRPPEWKIALELPEQGGVFRARHYDELADAPAELSAFAAAEFRLAGKRIRIVVDAESGDYDLGRLKDSAQKIAAAATGIMQDVPFPSYTFIHHFRREGGGGMEHANSTAIDSPPCRDCDLAAIIAHEFFHLWNVKRIRPQSMEPIDYTREQVTPSLWFAEGVTSTYGNYIQLEARLLGPEDFLRSLAGQITRYERIPARLAQSAEESSVAAWLERHGPYRRPSRSISYYLKGELIGYLLDLEIRHSSGNRRSLDDLLRRLNTDYAQRGRFFEDTAALERLSSELAGRDLRDFFDRAVRRAEPIDWDRYLGYAGYRLAATTAEAPTLGVEIARAPGRQPGVVELEPGGPAAAAGLRLGDRIVAVNGRAVPRARFNLLDGLDLKPGDFVNVEVERDSQTVRLAATPRWVPRVTWRIEDRPGAGTPERALRAAWLRW